MIISSQFAAQIWRGFFTLGDGCWLPKVLTVCCARELQPKPPFTGVSGPSGPKITEKSQNRSCWGSQKVPENTPEFERKNRAQKVQFSDFFFWPFFSLARKRHIDINFWSGCSWDDPGNVPVTNRVCPWIKWVCPRDKPGFSPYVTQWKPNLPQGAIPGTERVYVLKVYVHFLFPIFDFLGYLWGLFQDPQKDPFWDFSAILGPEGPETPVNGGSGRNVRAHWNFIRNCTQHQPCLFSLSLAEATNVTVSHAWIVSQQSGID